ncbi:hypothetical protein [Burkholderia pseudomultivorans]|nr:hypothetical protein [Burkholderia pseudomultivorans]
MCFAIYSTNLAFGNAHKPILTKLEAMGYPERHHDPSDERQALVGLTKSGRRMRETGLDMSLVEATGSKPDECAKMRRAIVTLRGHLIRSTEEQMQE